MNEKLAAVKEEFEIDLKNQLEIAQEEVNQVKETCEKEMKEKEIAECAKGLLE